MEEPTLPSFHSKPRLKLVDTTDESQNEVKRPFLHEENKASRTCPYAEKLVAGYCAEQEEASIMPAPLAICIRLMTAERWYWWWAESDKWLHIRLFCNSAPVVTLHFETGSNGYVHGTVHERRDMLIDSKCKTAELWNPVHDSWCFILWSIGTITDSNSVVVPDNLNWQPLPPPLEENKTVMRFEGWRYVSLVPGTAEVSCCKGCLRLALKEHLRLTASGVEYYGRLKRVGSEPRVPSLRLVCPALLKL